MEVPLGSEVVTTAGDILSPARGGRGAENSAGRLGKTPLSAETIDELGDLTQTLKIEQMRSVNGRKDSGGVESVVGGAEGDGGVATIRQTHDDVRALTAANADDGQLLSTERVMGMGDGHQSQREWGRRGSAL
jgi:hypothetical protein